MRCPTCKKVVKEAPAAPGQRSYFPFCSERCKLVDLGKWLDGKYQIPVEHDDKDEQDDRPGADAGV
jgi:endogenous inhibitor of DNA gyrase (YacG/DUF329 family)